MNKLILLQLAKVGYIEGYNGVCHGCNSPITCDMKILVLTLESNQEYSRYLFLDIFACPHCENKISTVQIYHNLNVTSEIKYEQGE